MIYNTLIVFFGIFIEAFPFLIIGVIISSLLTVYVSPELIARVFPRSSVRSLLVALVAGFAFPVCECGNIPVARGLLGKGVGPGPVITFLLAAPVFNPIAIVGTLVAFPDHPEITWLRVVFTGIIAFVVGAVFLRADREDVCREEHTLKYFTQTQAILEEAPGSQVSLSKGREESAGRLGGTGRKLLLALMLARDEFFYVSRFLVIGALVAALLRTLLPQDILNRVGTGPVISILAMIFLAFVLSMCSNVDAFFAQAFAGTFTTGALLAFLVFGPMIDIKAISMLYSTFKTRAIVLLTLLVFLLSLLFSLTVNFFFI